MSIIMVDTLPTASPAPAPAEAGDLDLNLRELLDHVAVELAHEYIGLMEAAAEAESHDE
jgi:hypothetical protein